jgi:hypothetical protein
MSLKYFNLKIKIKDIKNNFIDLRFAGDALE